MTRHRNHLRGNRRTTLAALRMLLVSAALALLVGGLGAAMPAGAATPVRAVTSQTSHKSAALARAEASGHLGLHGGQASGTAVGRSRVTRTPHRPALTPGQLQTQQRAAHRPVLEPKQPQGTSIAHRANPTSAASAGAGPSSQQAATPGPNASSDFDYFRSQDVSPGNFNSGTDEPSTANDGNVVLYTGNWYAAESLDSGHTWSYIDPYTLGPAPTLPNGGFCCDQATIHAANGITAWGLLYCPVNSCNSGDNLIRLAVARNKADLASGAFDYYDFSAQSFGFPSGDWLDYPHFGANADYLMLTMNVFNGATFQASIMVKFDLSSFLTGNWSANWVWNNQDFTWTPTDNSVDSWTYWAATAYGNGGLVRVYNWPPGTDYTHVSWNNFSVNFNYAEQNGSCPAPDGNNWCAFDDSRVKTGGEVGTSTVYFMWDAKQGGGFNYPYVDYASFNVSTGPATSISESQIWNGSYAWAYPGLGVNGRGALGLSIAIGGGTWGYPGSQFGIDDDISGGWVFNYLDQGSHSNNRWGDYLTARAATSGTSTLKTWIATGYTLHDSGGIAETYPAFYWVGRNRDDPFAPTWVTSYSNAYTEGASASRDTGVFYGPSNCSCDYTVTNGWGDGTSSAASLDNYAQDYFLLYGAHTYAEEGSFTTTPASTDHWAFGASGHGSATVADAGLTASGVTIYGAKGVSVKKSVATFTDKDPAGTATDYTATIHWGDGTSSTGTVAKVSTHFTVTGTHTYTSTGTKTISVAVKDVGGATASATSHAGIGLLPTISAVSPTRGTHAGGTKVTITGANFTGVTSVKFGTTSGSSVVVVSSTKITVKSPAHGTGPVNIRGTTRYGTSPVTTHDQYDFT